VDPALAYRVAPGVRLRFLGGDRVEVRAPEQGVPLRALQAGPDLLALLARLQHETPAALLLGQLRDARSRERASEALAELVRFGILRAVDPAPPPGNALDAGFVLFALGHLRYARLASNAALTVKARAPHCAVALVHDKEALGGLEPQRRELFDHLIECPAHMGAAEPFSPLLAKLNADRLSPFGCTVVLDADAVFLPHADVEAELRRYSATDFAPTVSFTHLPGRIVAGDRVIVWADAAECVERFRIRRPLRQCHLYYFAFTRSEATTRLFESARAVHRELRERPLRSMARWYGREVSAELAISIATGLNEFTIYRDVHVPMMNNAMQVFDGVWRHYLGFAFCGAAPDAAWRARYDETVLASTPHTLDALRWDQAVSGSDPRAEETADAHDRS